MKRAPQSNTLFNKSVIFRFKFVNRPQRIQNTVEYNFNLNIKDFLTKSKSEDINYQLYAVLLHHSHSANGGHYTCYVKHKNNLWYHLNDAKISCISEERVINDPDAYVLFYKRPKMNIWESSAEKRTQICSDDVSILRICISKLQNIAFLSSRLIQAKAFTLVKMAQKLQHQFYLMKILYLSKDQKFHLLFDLILLHDFQELKLSMGV